VTAPSVLSIPPASLDAGEAPRRPLHDFVEESGLTSLMLGSSKDPNAKVTILLVSERSGHPVFAVKIATTDAAAIAVEAEARLLLTLQRTTGLTGTLPQVVELVEHRGRSALVMTALPGTPMLGTYFRARHTASRLTVSCDFTAADGWLRMFHRETRQGKAPLELDGGMTARLRSRFVADPMLGEDIGRLDDILARLRQDVVSRSAVHGDFWFGNLLIADRGISGVVDWEAGATEGEGMRDIVRFALTYALYLDRRVRPGRRVPGHAGLRAGDWGGAVEFALDGTGWFAEQFRQFVSSGLVRMGASPTGWRDAALAGIAEIAAFTDDDQFARNHLELFRRLTRRISWREDP